MRVLSTGLYFQDLRNFQSLDRLHLSVTAVAAFLATLTVALSVLYWLFGLLIFWRKSQEWTGLLFSLFCVMVGSIGMFGFVVSAQTPQFVQLVTTLTISVLNYVGLVFFLIFPTGRFTPRWIWAVFVFIVLSGLPRSRIALRFPFDVTLSAAKGLSRWARKR